MKNNIPTYDITFKPSEIKTENGIISFAVDIKDLPMDIQMDLERRNKNVGFIEEITGEWGKDDK